MSRIQSYKDFKNLTGKTTYRRTRFPKGSTAFWRKALRRTIRKERLNTTKKIKKVFNKKNKNVKIKFNKALTKKYFVNKLRRYHDLNPDLTKIMKINDKYYTLNQQNIDIIKKVIIDGEPLEDIFGIDESDNEIIDLIRADNEIEIISYDKADYRFNEVREGAFFPYLCTDLYFKEWKRYGVFNKINKNNYKNNCLYIALKEHNLLSDSELDSIKYLFRNRSIPLRNIKKITQLLKIYIQIRHARNKRTINIGDKNSERKFLIGNIEKHYFIIDKKTNICRYALLNYDNIKNIDNWNHIYQEIKGKNKTNYAKNENNTMDSYKLILLLIEQKDKFLKKITLNDGIDSTQFYDKFKEIESLKYGEEINTRKIEIKEENEKNNKSDLPHVYFDFETKTSTKKHVPYLCCKIDDKGIKRTYKGPNCGYQLLQSIKQDSLLIAHNLGYDFRFLMKYLYNINIIEKGNSIMSGQACFSNKKARKRITLYFKDSYKIIPMKLSLFASCFNMKNIRKEVMPYELYTAKNLQLETCKISDALSYLKTDEEKQQFKKNLKEWNLIDKKDNTRFNHWKYSMKYCYIDCEVLKKGYETFRKWMLEVTNLNVDNYVSLPSLAHKFLINEGCYEGVCELSGVPREFIQKCLVGGRCMTKDNEKYHIKEKLQDFDAVSLYPSAMKRMIGFLKGTPKIIEDTSYDNIKNYDGYFVEVNIKKINKKRHFPLVSKINKEGIRKFSNDITGNVYLDKISLEDLIKYQDIEFEIIRGYYFDEGFNPQINKSISKLFEERLKKKKEKNPIQVVYKLIMNSSYGKTIMKPIETHNLFFNNEAKLMKYVTGNSNYIKYYNKVCNTGDKYIVKAIKPINNHFSIPQVGIEILSMSKRIMNEVMCLAEDNNIEIYYQDTDSMHIEDSKIDTLSKLFKDKFNRELIGKNMGQFHCDFDFKSDKLPVSVESYFLGKKCYIDKVKTINDGKINYHHHIRMKGVPSESIKYVNANPMQTYKKLFNGEEIEFDLLKSKIMFEFNNDYTINNRVDFKRKIKFV